MVWHDPEEIVILVGVLKLEIISKSLVLGPTLTHTHAHMGRKAPKTDRKKRKRSDYEHDDTGALKRQKCYKCVTMLDVSHFSVDNLRKTGLTSVCRPCAAVPKAVYRAKPESFVYYMIKGGEQADRAKKRDMKYGTDLTHGWFMQQFEHGCFWSGLPMQMKPFCWNKASIDRIDDSIRHCQENCRLTIIALNITRKWNDELMAECMDAYLYSPEPMTEEEALQMCIKQDTVKRARTTIKPRDGCGNLFCTWCDTFRDPTVFLTSDQSAGCKNCRLEKKRTRREKDMHTVLRNIFDNTLGAGKKQPFKAGDLSLKDLKELFVEQRGLCAISGIRMTLMGHFKVSPERIVSRGQYTKANVALVCQCFNVQDNTVLNKDSGAESQGLTKERWSIIIDSMIQKKRKEWRRNILGV